MASGITPQTPADQKAAAEARLAESKAKEAEAETRRVAALKEQGLDSRGLTIRPEFADVFETTVGVDKGEIKGDRLREGFRIGEFDDVNLDRRALERITQEGLSEGVTQAGQRQLDAQRLEQAGAFDDLRRGEAGAQAQALNQLSAQGGLSGGARERLARAGQRNVLIGRQGLRGQGAQQRAGILSQDEAAKRQLLGQAQQGAFQAGQFDQGERAFEAQTREFDIQNALAELQSKRDADVRAFEADRKAEAATKQAEAQKKGSCFAEGTMLPMADGTFKKIEDIQVDEALKVGGTIHSVLKTRITSATPMYDYEGVIISGGHAVLEKGKWIRVKDSKLAIPYGGTVDFVYNLANELHLIAAAGVCFADYEETDDFTISDDEALEILNRQLNERVAVSEQRVAIN